MVTIVDAVLVGEVRPFARGQGSAIDKRRMAGACTVGRLGIAGDAQADLAVHGGVDKAIHHYPYDHYGGWRETLGAHPLLDSAGAFGENISTSGLTEDAVCIGDRYRLGTALVEVAQGRQPCWKQAHRLAAPHIVKAMIASGRCGWYYRVIEEGSVTAGDAVKLVDRPHPDATVARVTAMVVAKRGRSPQAVAEISAIDALARDWHKRL